VAKRRRQGVLSTETPRLKDAPVGDSAPKRPAGADKRARLAIVQALVGFLETHGADEATGKRWLTEYRAFVRGLPSRTASVCDLVAARIRNSYLAETYALQAKGTGTHTPAGAKLAEMSHRCDMHAQRFALHARDLASREAGLPSEGATAALDAPEVAECTVDELLGRIQRLVDHEALDDARVAEVAAQVRVAPPPAAEVVSAVAPGDELLGRIQGLVDAAQADVAEEPVPNTPPELRRLRVERERERSNEQWDAMLSKGSPTRETRTGILARWPRRDS
jgi:hypothetical protein